MADRVQGLAPVLFAAALTLAAADFSHELHLKLVPSCATCHASASSSVTAQDNLLPRPEACVACHGEVSIRPEPRPTVVANFNHALHVKFGNIAPLLKRAMTDKKRYLSTPDANMARHLETGNACAACHRGIEESTVTSAANHPKMADCLVCHNKIDPPDSCVKCHAPAVAAKPATHSPDFLDRHTSSKAGVDKTNCAVCHGRTFTCLGCH